MACSTLLLMAILQGNLLEEYRRADFSQKKGAFDDSCRTRMALEYQIIQAGSLAKIRPALQDPNRNVRAFAVTALGILEDRKSVSAVAGLAKNDPDAMVRGMAVQTLGWLKAGEEVIASAASDKSRDVRFLAKVAKGHLGDPVDYAAQVRKAYKAMLPAKKMGVARVGRPAPDFSAVDTEGRLFTLSSHIGKRIVVITFQLADW